MAALDQGHLVDQANTVIDFLKKWGFNNPPEDIVSWDEMKAWLKSDKPE